MKQKYKKNNKILYVFDYDDTLITYSNNYLKKRKHMFDFFNFVKNKYDTKILTARNKHSISHIKDITGLSKKNIFYKKDFKKSILDEKVNYLKKWSNKYDQVCYFDDNIITYGYNKEKLGKNIALFDENGKKVSKYNHICKINI